MAIENATLQMIDFGLLFANILMVSFVILINLKNKGNSGKSVIIRNLFILMILFVMTSVIAGLVSAEYFSSDNNPNLSNQIKENNDKLHELSNILNTLKNDPNKSENIDGYIIELENQINMLLQENANLEFRLNGGGSRVIAIVSGPHY